MSVSSREGRTPSSSEEISESRFELVPVQADAHWVRVGWLTSVGVVVLVVRESGGVLGLEGLILDLD